MSCDIGLGSALDLEAPEITIISPKSGENLPKTFTITGTCKDNVKVTRVIVQEQIGDQTRHLADAKIQGETWSAQITLETDGDTSIVCTAQDAMGNSSTKSKQTVTFVIDETAPTAKDWSVNRGQGNKPISLVTNIERLKTLDLSLSTNKLTSQNEKFTISGKFDDAVSIAQITLSLYEEMESGTESFIISKTLTPYDYLKVSPNGSIYSPSWDFTEEELVEKSKSLKNGKHYLKVVYESLDNAGNKSSLINVGYFLWYPESDEPGVEINTEDDKLVINTGSIIPLTFFDDDGISEVGYDLITEKVKTDKGITLENLETHISQENKKTTEVFGKDDVQVQILTKKEDGSVLPSGKYYLLVYVKEKKTDKTPLSKKRLIEVTIIDDRKPFLIIEKPNENEIPKVEQNSKFTISGYSYDTSGSKFVKIAYIPGNDTNSAKDSRARTLLASDAVPRNLQGTTSSSTEGIVRKYDFNLQSKPSAKDGYVQEKFEFTFDLLNDFSTEKNARKFFMLMVEDLDNNREYKQLIVEADTEKPEFDIQEPQEMQVIDYSKSDLHFKFKATKSSGLGIDEKTYKVIDNNNNKEYTFNNNGNGLTWNGENGAHDFITLTIPKSELQKMADSSSQQVFLFECSDILGNKAQERRVIVLSPLPVLESITVEQANGTYGIGKEIVFLANFSDTVKVTGSPRLKLEGITNGGKPVERYADYVPGNNSDTLKFKYIVKDGDESSNLSCADSSIDLKGGKIETGTLGTGNATITYTNGKNFWDSTDSSIKKEIKLDGVKPKIENVTANVTGVTKQNGDKYYAKEARQVLVTVTFSEPVLISANESLKIGNLTFTQNSMGHDSKTAVYAYTVKANDNQELSYNLASCFEKFENIKDSVGNTLAKGTNESKKLNVVLDTTSPKAPNSTGINDKDIFNKPPEFTVTQDSSDSDIQKLEYSLDNGQTWNDYSDKVTIENGGTYSIIVRATDYAGNTTTSDSKTITFNDQFPEILEIALDSPDGNYKLGDKLIFSVTLADTVKSYQTTDATLIFEEFQNTNGTTTLNSKTINVVASDSNDSNVLKFEYQVAKGDNFKGIHISALSLKNIQDKYTNTQDKATTEKIEQLTKATSGACYRQNIKLDGDAPTIVSRKPSNNEAIKVNEENGYLTITLTFNEPVYKESGTITLQRKGTWGIPAVMTVEEFNKVYNSSSLNATDKEVLKHKDKATGIDKLDGKTGQPVGPYKKLTHGLKLEGDKYVPDIDTKYVLDFDLGLYEGEKTIEEKKVDVAQIRKVFEKTGYHQHSLQVGSNQITASEDSKTWTITFPEKIQEGIKWELLISQGAFRDEVGNLFAGLTSQNDDNDTSGYTLWTDKVSTPVVRVDRYSHGYGAKEPDKDGKLTEITANGIFGTPKIEGSGGMIAPTGYVRVRVDTQTPGAKITYRKVNTGAFNAITGQPPTTRASLNDTIPFSQYKLQNGLNQKEKLNDSDKKWDFLDNVNSSQRCSVSEIPDLKQVQCNTTTDCQDLPTDNHIIIVGDGDYKTARKDYVIAQASLDSVKIDGKNMTTSSYGVEGAFKTVIYSKRFYNMETNQFNIEGGTSNYGAPSIAGFPVRDGPSKPSPYSKNAYNIQNGEHIFVSYEFVSTWSVLLQQNNNSKGYGRSDYGQATYFCGYFHY